VLLKSFLTLKSAIERYLNLDFCGKEICMNIVVIRFVLYEEEEDRVGDTGTRTFLLTHNTQNKRRAHSAFTVVSLQHSTTSIKLFPR